MVDSVAELDAETTLLVLDFVGALRKRPLAPRERKHFRGYALWASHSVSWEIRRCRIRINTYVDDPLT